MFTVFQQVHCGRKIAMTYICLKILKWFQKKIYKISDFTQPLKSSYENKVLRHNYSDDSRLDF